VIENQRAASRVGDDAKAKRKLVKAKPPEGFVHYDEATMDRLIAARPEPLTSRFRVTTDLVATVLRRPDGPTALKRLLDDNHDPVARRRDHKRRAIAVYRSLEAAGVAERRRDADGHCLGVRVGSLADDGDDTALRFSSPLIPFAIEVIGVLDPEDPLHTLDVVSVIESVLDDPRQVLLAQLDAARSAAIAQMKADGVPYEERIERLDGITAPRPLADLLDSCFDTYRGRHPWVDAHPSPKSVVREMLERGDTFGTLVGRYRLERSEGLVLRYLTDAWRTLGRSLPDDLRTDPVRDVVEWLGALVRATDATLMDEWERLAGGEAVEREAPAAPSVSPPAPPAAWRTAVRTAAFGWVELLARRDHRTLAERCAWSSEDLWSAMADYWTAYDAIGIDGEARGAAWFQLHEEPGRWVVTQQLVDPAGDGEWRFVAEVDLEAALADGAPTLRLVSLGTAAG
jgi:hypothetical protein